MSGQPDSQFSTKHTWVVGLGASSVAVFVNLVILYFANGILGIPADFVALRGMTVVLFTILGALLATLVFWIMTRLLKNPIRTFQRLALVVLILSIIPHIRSILRPPALDMPIPAALIGGLFIIFHITTAAVCIWFLSTKTQID